MDSLVLEYNHAMQALDFNIDAPGAVVRSLDGIWCFRPDPLPPTLQLDMETGSILSQANHALGKLSGAGRMLPNPHLLISPFLRREAILSSRIEGTIASAREIAAFEIDPRREPIKPDVREVSNYVSALRHGLTRSHELPVSLRLIRELHGHLMHGVRGGDKNPGEFRTTQNWIALAGTAVEQARYVPPAVSDMRIALDEFEKFIHAPARRPSLIDIALIHYQFEAIHPFENGNGRIGRLLISLLLCERELLSEPLLYLSAYFDRHNKLYADSLLAISQQGKWRDWIHFFLRGIVEQSHDAENRCWSLLNLWRDYRDRVQKVNAPALGLRLVDHLFGEPLITVPIAQKLLGVTYRAAKNNLDKLVTAKILRETRMGSTRLYVADKLLKLTEDSLPEAQPRRRPVVTVSPA
jgi:Fic family protein